MNLVDNNLNIRKFYELYSNFFDETTANPDIRIERIRRYLWNGVKSILDIGCWTGSVLNWLSEISERFWIDISPEILTQAKRKTQWIHFTEGNMLLLQKYFNRKFDAIISCYDTINHLLLWEEWLNLFLTIRSHLNKNWIFIFDVNTPTKFYNRINSKPKVIPFWENECIQEVKKISDNIFEWTLNFCIYQGNNQHENLQSSIKQACFPNEDIKKELSKYFSQITIETENPWEVLEKTERAYFICKA